MTSRFNIAPFLVALIAAAGLLTACSGPGIDQTQSSSEETDYSHVPDMPDFKGPWAEDFRYAYARAANEKIRDYLRDEVITEAEKQEVTEAFRNCMVSRGLTFDDFDDDGSYSFEFAAVNNPDEANEIANNCENETGVFEVVSMYFSIRANPENKDQTPEIVACLIRSGVVPRDYTVEQRKQRLIDDYAIVDEFEAWEADQACEKDPEGAFRD
ncbi:hypothetical protein ICM05_05745 [Leucobacter sp. cx-42]|uniref:hypothetical protein n=1 Tax=unclassified Leucobacter TaxID=2621730 RepID=UPI00165D748D|nr:MULTISPECIES: hypothetical protein [unclassified Leucobacter]MBC9954150.1 hypothetical protein [Leucobacter sp. cx-42]